MKLRPNWKRLVGLVLLLLVIWAAYRVYQEKNRIIPPEVVNEALSRTLAAKSFRYRVEVKTLRNGRETIISRVEGERADENTFRIKGEILSQKAEIYHVGDKTYFLDPVSEKWLVTPGGGLFQNEFFMTELNPLASFRFPVVEDAQYLGTEEIRKRKTYVFRCQPEVNNNFLETYWEDFEYQLWVDRKSRRLVRGIIKARNRKDPEHFLSVKVDLFDFNTEIKIEPPRI
ncbi:hypothetical protein [Calderihabitans maritimus]|uniref:NAD-dependent aldehyde dehydrogenases n=1 Tax=Calderihabitans maritimus TaxID=1246530 RepID=A0A1Z5HS72_9FIRM|nr:hypothetical protein [Calderihabitans maritimus]GAW92181.1 NAD-dependent aldehyde dehydrogenases [Calderihabitans maritimus]